MHGVGGLLLCIGDLLSDVADDGIADGDRQLTSAPSSPSSSSNDYLSLYALQGLFQVHLSSNSQTSPNFVSGCPREWTHSNVHLREMICHTSPLANSNVPLREVICHASPLANFRPLKLDFIEERITPKCISIVQDFETLIRYLCLDYSTKCVLFLCAALEKADKLVLSANSKMNLLLEKVQVLENILRRGDAAVMKAKEIVQVPRED
ncbi:hypothetical protein AXF42_Ash013128 [Apostasia shenzhenica]|uniref:Uncharacterized protein n=1 Tax=Apostasia shenzhenica TaxID=1088818 RepID=A0A2I0BD39_9ASPA|nr:hypothetical protein AXF42_Ash013128 [Apostasia shenzhenica]